MKTNRDITQKYRGAEITIPAGAEVIFIPNAGKVSGYAIKNTADLIKAGAWKHDSEHYYFYVPKDSVSDLLADATLIRSPLSKKSDNWQETAFQWLVDINGQKFDYFTGAGLVDKATGKPNKLKLDDVLHSLVMDASACEQSFEDWCADFGSDSDSIRALETYRACQKNAAKLRKAGVNIEAERERLADY